VLSSDIRKLPSLNQSRRVRRAPNKITLREGGLDADDVASSSTAVSTMGDTSTAVTPNDTRMSSRSRAVKYASGTTNGRQKGEAPKQQLARYWSEYEHPEDDSGEEGYFIYVNPDEDETWIPFKDTAQTIYHKIKALFQPGHSEDNQDNAILETEPLLQPTSNLPKSPYSVSTADSYETSTSSSEDDASDTDILMPRARYGTLPVSQPRPDHEISQDFVNTTIAAMVSLFFATTLSVVLLVLSAVGRKRARGEIDVVVLAGSLISVCFAIAGLWGLVFRSPGVVRWLVAAAVFIAVVVVDGVLIGRLLRDVQLDKIEK